MAIANVVLRGFSNGTVSTTIPLVVTRGYAIGEADFGFVFVPAGRTYQVAAGRRSYQVPEDSRTFTVPARRNKRTVK